MAANFLRSGMLVAMALTAAPALAAQPSGSAVAVVQQASIDGASGKQVLQKSAPVFSGDRIDTDAGGSAQIVFVDNTRLVVGPNSSLVIDAFVFGGSGSAKQFSIDAVKGAFRFITGNSAKDAYTINTPTATIGVRGTEFDVTVEREGTTRVANFEGATRICHRGAAGNTDCVVTSEACTLSVTRPNEAGVRSYSNKDVEYRNRQLEYYFPYIRSQDALLAPFKVDVARCKASAAITPNGGITTPPGGTTPPSTPYPGPVSPSAPSFGTPATPGFGDRGHDRGGSDHGGVFR